jgi:hypothetical protein
MWLCFHLGYIRDGSLTLNFVKGYIEYDKQVTYICDRGQLKCDGTRAETRFCLSAKRTSPFKSVGASVQSTTGSQVVHINGSNAGYTIFRGSVKSTGYSLHSPVSPSLSPSVRHRLPSHFKWSLQPLFFFPLPSPPPKRYYLHFHRPSSTFLSVGIVVHKQRIRQSKNVSPLNHSSPKLRLTKLNIQWVLG